MGYAYLDSNTAERLEINLPTVNRLKRFLIHFRRPSDYEKNGAIKEYGFDWLRDEYIHPINTITKDQNGNPLATPLQNQPLCLNPQDLRTEYLNDVLDSITPYGNDYYPAWLSLENGKDCLLNLEIEALESLATLPNTKLVFEVSDENAIKITDKRGKEFVDNSVALNPLITTKITKSLGGTPVVNKDYYEAIKAIKISCTSTFAAHQQIRVFAESGILREEIGKLMLYNNQDMYSLKARFVEVKFEGNINYFNGSTNFKLDFDNDKPELRQGGLVVPSPISKLNMSTTISNWKKYIKGDEKRSKQKFGQALIKYEYRKDGNGRRIEYRDLIIDYDNFVVGVNPNSTGVGLDRIKDSIVSLNPDSIECDMEEFLTGLKEVYLDNHNEETGIIVFLMPVVIKYPLIGADKGFLDGIADDIFNTGKYIMLPFKSDVFSLSTLSHEAAHTMGLFHTFETARNDNGRAVVPEHSFRYETTENIMDYTANRYSLFKWQWDKLRLDNNDLELLP